LIPKLSKPAASFHLARARERLAPKIGPTRIVSKGLALWPEDKQAITTKELKDARYIVTHRKIELEKSK
jgi:hypothetical protein